MSELSSYHPHPLPVTIVTGMPVFDITDCPAGTIAAITQSYCVYRLAQSETVCVARWRDIALGNVCPAAPLLSADVTANDRRNAQATLLAELLQLQRVAALTAVQTSALEELRAELLS